MKSMHGLLDVAFSEDDCRFLSENANRAMNVLHKFALAVHKNFLACHHKKVSIKAHMFSALLHLPSSSLSFAFYVTGVKMSAKPLTPGRDAAIIGKKYRKSAGKMLSARLQRGGWLVKSRGREKAGRPFCASGTGAPV